MTSPDVPTTSAVVPATTIAPRLRFAYRLICVAAVVAAAALAFNLIEQSKRSVGDANEAEKQRSQLQQVESTLTEARTQRDQLKELVARAQQGLAAAEQAKGATAPH
jgi:chemotaxis regulatin CheY-phosphate phosphatase CheZ